MNLLKVTAQNALLPEKVASRLLRIQIKDLDDNQPSFGEIDGSLRRVFTVDNDQNREHLDNIGTVHADDPDGAPFNSIYYYLLPSCSNRDGKFSIDERSGMVQVNNYEALQSAEYHLCALASAYHQSTPPEIAFDNRNESMLAFTVEVTPLKMAQLFRVQSAIRFDNNTITTFGENIYTPIPITMDRSDPSSSNLEYVLDSVAFIPSETSSQSTAAETSQPSEANDYFVVDPETANVYIDPSLMHHDEGVFKLRINVIQSTMNTSMARLYKQVHNLRSSSRLKFVFDNNANVMSLNLDDFRDRLNSVLNMDTSQHRMLVVVDTPQAQNKNRSSVCFHVLRDDVILGQESAVSALSTTVNDDSKLSRLYQAFKVANIEPCVESEQTLSSGIVISTKALFWASIALLGILILMSCCLYSCFIVRYKWHLQEKKSTFTDSEASSLPSKPSSPTVQFYNIQNLPRIAH